MNGLIRFCDSIEENSKMVVYRIDLEKLFLACTHGRLAFVIYVRKSYVVRVQSEIFVRNNDKCTVSEHVYTISAEFKNSDYLAFKNISDCKAHKHRQVV